MGRREEEADLAPLGVVQATTEGGWTIVNLHSLKVVEPGYVWPRREQAVAWARAELERQRREEVEYLRRLDAPGAAGA